MIVVIGSPVFAGEGQLAGHRAAGTAARIALAAARASLGRGRVELVGKVGDDAGGDSLVVDLQRAGVGHAALLRDPSSETPRWPAAGLVLEREDVELALRYLPEARVIVSADPLPDPVAEAVSDAARYGGTHRIEVLSDANGALPGRDADAKLTLFRAPDRDDGPFAELVGRYAALLDAGRAPADAFAAARAEVGWEPDRHA